jgi:hypothetical protein
LAEAEPLVQRTVAIREQVLGPDHPSTRCIRQNLSLLRGELAPSAEGPA